MENTNKKDCNNTLKKVDTKKAILIGSSIFLIIIALIICIVYIPKYQLNKAVEYIKRGEYQNAYTYVNNRHNEDNKRIVKELISMAFIQKCYGGIKQSDNIVTKAASIIKNINTNNIDYTLDDTLNIYVGKLKDYISIESSIPKDIIIPELHEVYQTYFDSLKFVNDNFYNFLNNITNKEFTSRLPSVTGDCINMAVILESVRYNYNFLPQTIDIYAKIESYL